MDNVAEFLAKMNTKIDSQLAEANQYFELEHMPLANDMDDVLLNINDMIYRGFASMAFYSNYTFSSTNISNPLFTVPHIRWRDYRGEQYFPDIVIISNCSSSSGSVNSNKAIHTMILEKKLSDSHGGYLVHDFDGVAMEEYAALIFTYGAISPIIHKDITIQYSTSQEGFDKYSTTPYSLTLNNIDVGFVPGSEYSFISYLSF